MFHSIGCEKENWYRKWLSISLDHFETFCKYLANNNYKTVFLDDQGENSNSQTKIALTFDDGYLDNWVYAYPILKKHGLKATIFVNPEFIQNETKIRHNLEDVWSSRIKRSELSPLGFLNWSEIKFMQDSGVIDIQSHSMSHNFHSYSNKILDIYTGQAKYNWLPWLTHPKQKPYYINEDQSEFANHGYPIFEYDRALRVRRYIPDVKFIEYAINEYSESINKKNKKAIINNLNEKLSKFPGKFESDEKQRDRYIYELKNSKDIIQQKLNKPINVICWPGGGFNQLSLDVANEVGYTTMTGSPRSVKPLNSGNLKLLGRKSMTSFIDTNKRYHLVKNKQFLVTLFKYHNGNTVSKYKYYIRKLCLMILDKLH